MSYLVDTTVLSELRRKVPNKAVQGWFAVRPASTLFLSMLALGEIRKGIEAVADAQRRMRLIDWLEADLPAFFTGRILGIDTAVADRWGRMVAAAGSRQATAGHRQPAGRHSRPAWPGAGNAQRARLRGPACATAGPVGGGPDMS